jgi:hypothetical protein
VQVSPSDPAVVIDGKKGRRVRPSVVVGQLGALRQRPPKFRADAFIESLAGAYDLVVAEKRLPPGSAARLVDLHKVLTLLPGAARDYTIQEFSRDPLDQKGIVETKAGRRMSLPASALTRASGALPALQCSSPRARWRTRPSVPTRPSSGTLRPLDLHLVGARARAPSRGGYRP